MLILLSTIFCKILDNFFTQEYNNSKHILIKLKIMIHSFSFENFYSFKNKNEISFVVDKNAPDNDGYFVAPSGTRLSKVNIVVGANASGKSNALKVVPFMHWFILRNIDDKEIPINVFEFVKNKNEISKMSVVFEINKIIYSYAIALTKEKVVQEKLIAKQFIKKRRSKKVLFSRVWNENLQKYDIEDKNGFHVPESIYNSLTMKKASLLGTAYRYGHAKSEEIIKFWKNIQFNQQYMYKEDELTSNSQMNNMLSALEIYENDKKVLEMVEEYLNKFDTGLSKIKVQSDTENKNKKLANKKFLVEGIHKIKNRAYPLYFAYESLGTKHMLILLALIFYGYCNSKSEDSIVNVIDELDVSLHPEITDEIINLLFYPQTRAQSVQTIITTHNPLILKKI